MPIKTRRFRAAPGRTLVLPSGLTEGPQNDRMNPGDVRDIDVRRIDGCRELGVPSHARFINTAKRHGDLLEETAPDVAPAAPAKKE